MNKVYFYKMLEGHYPKKVCAIIYEHVQTSKVQLETQIYSNSKVITPSFDNITNAFQIILKKDLLSYDVGLANTMLGNQLNLVVCQGCNTPSDTLMSWADMRKRVIAALEKVCFNQRTFKRHYI